MKKEVPAKTEAEHDSIFKEFTKLVNMPASDLKKWLDTKESKEVGWDSGDGESIGHHSGRRIIDILAARKTELTADDYKHMNKVTGYIKRHLAQKPAGDDTHTRWHYSLKNWGHDYTKR